MTTIFFVTVSVLFVASVLLQQKNASLGSMMGGDGGDEIAQARRGADKFLHQLSIALAIALLGGAVWTMFA